MTVSYLNVNAHLLNSGTQRLLGAPLCHFDVKGGIGDEKKLTTSLRDSTLPTLIAVSLPANNKGLLSTLTKKKNEIRLRLQPPIDLIAFGRTLAPKITSFISICELNECDFVHHWCLCGRRETVQRAIPTPQQGSTKLVLGI